MDATVTESETTPPSGGNTITAPVPTETQSQSTLFERMTAYPFVSDLEFAKGLAIILGHPDTPASSEEIARNDNLILQAKCYYYSRKERLSPPLDAVCYKTWLEGRSAHSVPIREYGSSLATPTLPPQMDEQSGTSSLEPTYPTSFAHIVELITTGQPIPGIKQIPDTLLTGQGAESARPRRSKPWESQNAARPC